MRFVPLLALASWLILLLPVLALSGCVGAPPIVATPSACASLLPEAWRMPVPGAPLPINEGAIEGNTVGDWIAFGDAQTGQLDKANDRTLSSIAIVERCEQLNREAVAKAKRPWWKIF